MIILQPVSLLFVGPLSSVLVFFASCSQPVEFCSDTGQLTLSVAEAGLGKLHTPSVCNPTHPAMQ